MRRTLLITTLVIVGFVSIVVYRLPASWVVPRPPAQAGCNVVSGSIWRGQCGGLTVQGQEYGDVLWTLHPASLLIGKLSAHVVLTRGPASARADVEARSSQYITLRNVMADLPLDPTLIPRLPPTVRGSAHLDLVSLVLDHSHVASLQGRVEIRDVVERSMGGTSLGNYALIFPPGTGGDPTAELRDLGGPLSVEGTLKLKLTPPGYDLQALVATRPTAPAELSQMVNQTLRYMGSPDAQGRRPFSLEGRL